MSTEESMADTAISFDDRSSFSLLVLLKSKCYASSTSTDKLSETGIGLLQSDKCASVVPVVAKPLWLLRILLARKLFPCPTGPTTVKIASF